MSAGRTGRLAMLALCGALALLFGGLGWWQVERLQWKRSLIARVEARLTAPPVAPPPRQAWDRLAPDIIEYRRVRVVGRFDHRAVTRVDALTERGPGDWIVTPLRTPDGTILVNRGFVPKGWKDAATPTGDVTVTGLLRLSEPDGRILRPNRPDADRWYSRDVAAIARARRLSGVAPFFVDAGAAPRSEGAPVGGMTVIRFADNHLIYALTWFALAALCVAGFVIVLKNPARRG